MPVLTKGEFAATLRITDDVSKNGADADLEILRDKIDLWSAGVLTGKQVDLLVDYAIRHRPKAFSLQKTEETDQ